MLTSGARIWAFLAVLFAIVLDAGCSRVPRLTEFDEKANSQARSAPLVVVGVADSDATIGRPVPSRRDPTYPMQLHRVRVQIENVLRGSISEQTIFVYYFGFGGGFEGPRPLGFGREPSRRILWLRRDEEVLRMACDGWDGCTMPVESGAHPRYRADPRKSLDYALVDILLTRGEGESNNVRFASQILRGTPDQGFQGYVIEKLGHLALTESGDVKSSACTQLWIYTQDWVGRCLQQQAQESLQAASCDCHPKPHSNVVCQ
jgi:hypothetical protein